MEGIIKRAGKRLVLLMLCCFAVILTFGLTVNALGAEPSDDFDSIVHVFEDIEEVSDQDLAVGVEGFLSDELTVGTGEDLNNIIGSDDRVKVGNTKVFPYSAVARISFVDESENASYLTGFFISPNTVITNAHGVYNVKTRAWTKRLVVIPGYSNGVFPFDYGVAVSAVIHSKYINNSSSGVDYGSYHEQYDLAVLKLNKSFSTVGSFPLSAGVSMQQPFRLIGYPDDKGGQAQYESSGTINNIYAETVRHNADVWEGNSGSPMLSSNNQVIAVLCSGDPNGKYNVGVRLTTAKINWINSAKNSYLPVYRVYNPNSGEHFYTIDYNEKKGLVDKGWQDEGLAWSTSSSGVAVYRLYNSNGSEHHYTTSSAERDALANAGWSYEKVAWYSPTSDAYPIYRLRNPSKTTNNHHFTISAAERDGLVSFGWENEGVAWYGY